jgi:hypothetical protein
VAKKKLPNAEKGDPVPLRVVLDYRGVNARSMPDRYSIKEVRECINEIGRSDSDRYSCINLTSGFWQMELEEESRQYTALSVPGKAARFHWCVAPMGLQESPASFARLMDYVMRGILRVLTYIDDDVLVHNKGHEEHLKTVEEVLLRLRKYGLKLKADKSIFGATTVQYLGYTINQGDEAAGQLQTDKGVCRVGQLLQVPDKGLQQNVSANDGTDKEGLRMEGGQAAGGGISGVSDA